ncbi:tetratricopeptide repeat-containing diguanylate cyclase [Colwellia sp. E150_009]
MRLVFQSIVFVLFSHCFFVASAAKLTDSTALEKMEHELNSQPWETYQLLLAQSEQLDDMSDHYKSWWLLRKAQAENLLYFFDRFEQTVNQAVASVSQQTPAKIMINLDIFRGVILQRQGRYRLSETILKKAKQVALNHKYTYLAVLAKQELAYTKSLTQIYQTSLTELQQAYLEAFAIHDEFLIAKINEVYGAIYGYMHDYEKSIEYYQKALSSYQQLGYPAHQVEAIYGLASTYRYWKNYELAIEYYQRYQEDIDFSPNNIDGKFYAAYGIAMSKAEQGDCSQALISIDYAISIEGLIDYKAELYKRKSQCLLKLGRLDEAQTALDKASDIFDTLPELTGTHWQIELYEISAELAEAQGHSQEAYQLLKLFNKKEIELIKKNMSDRLLHIRGTLEAERQDVEISLLQQNAKVQQLQFEQQKQSNIIQDYLMAFVFLLVFFMFFLAYFQWYHNKKLTRLSVRDPLSNSFNRRYVFNFLHKLVNANRSDKNTVSIMVIDIDDFKQVNDLYGHPFGDKVIRKIAEIGTEILRIDDVIGRVGGEEFLCVLPRIDAVQCLHIAQRFVNKVNEHEFTTEVADNQTQKVKVTVSVGLSTTSKNTKTSSELYVQADKALYHAKASGKNRAIQYQDSMQYANKSNLNAKNSPVEE